MLAQTEPVPKLHGNNQALRCPADIQQLRWATGTNRYTLIRAGIIVPEIAFRFGRKQLLGLVFITRPVNLTDACADGQAVGQNSFGINSLPGLGCAKFAAYAQPKLNRQGSWYAAPVKPVQRRLQQALSRSGKATGTVPDAGAVASFR